MVVQGFPIIPGGAGKGNRMRLLAIPLAIAGLVLALLLGSPIAERWRDSNDYQRTLETIKAQDYAYQVEQTAAARAATSNAMSAIAVLALVVTGMLAVDFYRQRRDPIVRAGGLPIARRAILDADQELVDILAMQIRASGIAQIEAARQPGPVAHSLTYAPRISAPAQLGAAQLDQVLLPAPALASVPTFANLLDGGRIGPDADGRQQLLVLGYGEEGAIEGDWRSLYSSAAGGLQGSGKTWGTAFLLAQSAAAGAQLVICDPQAGDVESLANRVAPLRPAMLCDIADDDKSIGAALDLAYDVLDRRDKGDPDRRPIIVAIDEWLSLRRGKLADRLPELVEAFATRGRKMNVHCMLLTQRADKDAIGDFRNTLASSYIYRMRPDEARMLTGLRAAQLPNDVLQLEPGECYLLDTRGTLRKVRIPFCTPADLARVGALLGGKNPVSSSTDTRPFGFQPAVQKTQMKPGFESRESSLGSPATLDAQSARILALFAQGMSVGEIVKAIWGEISGPKYNQARAQVEQTLRGALARVA